MHAEEKRKQQSLERDLSDVQVCLASCREAAETSERARVQTVDECSERVRALEGRCQQVQVHAEELVAESLAKAGANAREVVEELTARMREAHTTAAHTLYMLFWQD